jgi:hypothetical protein
MGGAWQILQYIIKRVILNMMLMVMIIFSLQQHTDVSNTQCVLQ